MRTHYGFKTVPCTIENSHIEVKGKSYQLYSLEELSHYKIIYWSFPIIGIPLSLCLAFLSVILLIMSQNSIEVLHSSIMLFFAITLIGVIIIFSYKMLIKYRGQWIANGTKPIYIEKTDEEHIESLLMEAKKYIIESKYQHERKFLKKDSILVLVFLALGFAALFVPLPEDYNFIFLVPISIAVLFSAKTIKDEATWK